MEEKDKIERREFFEKLAAMMEQSGVEFDLEDVSCGWDGGIPKVIIGTYRWNLSFHGTTSVNHKDIIRALEEVEKWESR